MTKTQSQTTHTARLNRTIPEVKTRYRPFSLQEAVLVATACLGGLMIILPLVGLVWRGVAERGWMNLPAAGVPEAIWLSYLTTTLSLGLSLLIGTPLAYVLARRNFPFKAMVNTLVELPIVLPPAVAGLALLLTFGRRGLLGGVLEDVNIRIPFTMAAVVIAQTFVSMPFYVRSAVVGFMGVSPTLEEAAQVDGADERGVFWLITLPLSSRALLAGLMLSWTRALGEFGATLLFAGNLRGVTRTMPLLIYSVLERDIAAAIWTGILLLLVAVVALAISRWLSGGDNWR